MDDNEFRAWAGEEMIDGDYNDDHFILTIEDGKVIVLEESLDEYGGYYPAVAEIMQFIDIIDKNGNKIYQGDKLRFSHWIIEVEKHLGAFGYWVNKDKEWRIFVPFSGHNQIEYFGNQTNDLEVVGHIYEN